MKKIILVLISVLMFTACLSGCGKTSAGTDGSPAQPSDDSKLSIVTTIFPEYDWVMQILGDRASNADVTMLLDNGLDLHNYQPTADDIIKISTCDLFIYVGGQSDSWTADALKGAANPDMVVINLMDVLGETVKEEEVVEGMEDEDHDHDDAGDDNQEEAPEYDEHVWLSLKNASVLCQKIADSLGTIDSENKAVYEANAAEYLKKLSDLDGQFQEMADNAATKTILFGDRFPFRYLADDYGLTYYAAFTGCSAESEASFETIAFLASKVDELDLSTILTLEGTDHKIAETVLSTTSDKDARILSMDSMQSVTSQDIREGATYLSIMEENLNTLKQALS